MQTEKSRGEWGRYAVAGGTQTFVESTTSRFVYEIAVSQQATQYALESPVLLRSLVPSASPCAPVPSLLILSGSSSLPGDDLKVPGALLLHEWVGEETMGRKKARLLTSDQYGRHVAAWRCAELLYRKEGEDGPFEIRLEDARFSPWDDLTEEYRAAQGHLTQHVWQIKRQSDPLKRADIVPLLEALRDHPSVNAHLGLYRLVEVPKVGSFVNLAELCHRLRQPGLDPSLDLELSEAERRWIRFAQPLMGGAEQHVLALFRRLEVVDLGSEWQIQRRAEVPLERRFTDPQRAYQQLLAFLANYVDGAIRITSALLLEKGLQGLEQLVLPSSSSVESCRREYLASTVAAYQSMFPLRMLTGRGAPTDMSPRLADIFAVPVLHAVTDEEALPRPSEKSETPGTASHRSEEEEEDPSSLSFDRLLSEPADLRLVELLLDPTRLAERPRYLLEGSVGTGKSTFLEHLRFRLAERAQADPKAPLPIKVEARDLAEGLPQAALQGSHRFDPKLLQAHPAGFILLVDGLDEVDERRARRVQPYLHELSLQPSTVALIMTGRPATTYIEPPPGVVRLRMASWSRAKVYEFLDLWRKRDPKRVEALEQLARVDALLPILTTPLTATFALVLVEQDPGALKRKTLLFQGIEEKLFTSWVKRRSSEPGTAERSWKDLAPALRRLALESLRTGQEDLTHADLRRHLGREAIDQCDEWIDDTHRRFGLLVYQDDHRYRFLLRGIAEHLAGAALLEEGPKQILASAQEAWAAEPVRHAIGLGVERHGVEWALLLLRELLPGRRGILVADVRPLLVAAHVALDLGEEAEPLAEPLAEALAKLLTLETSVWSPQVATQVARELARLGGPCWDALLRRLEPYLTPRCSPAQWYMAQPDRGSDEWLEALKHRSVEGRRVALTRLTAWVDVPKVREALLDQLLDPSTQRFMEPPAPHAGLVLRKATRDAHFRERILPPLVELATHGSSLTCGAAALALRPDEAPVRLLAGCMHRLGERRLIYLEVLQELVAHPEGAAALDEIWKEWRSIRDLEEEAPLAPVEGNPGPRPPLSGHGIQNLLRAIGPAVARLPVRKWKWGLFSFESREILHALCEAAWEHPHVVVETLEHSDDIFPTREGEFLLGEAAVRHPELRAALLACWARRKDDNARGHFPGSALAALVARGDREAAEAYARWIQVTFWLRSPSGSILLAPAALRHPTVRPAAIGRASDAWRQYKDGWIEDGKPVRLAGQTMAVALRALRPAWEDVTELKSELIRNSQEGDEALTTALSVFSRPPYPKELGELVVDRLEKEVADSSRKQNPWQISFWLSWAERASIAERLRGSLEHLRTWSSWLQYQATTVLISSHASLARELSRQASEVWPEHWETNYLPRSTLARLVRANPDAWYRRVLDVLDLQLLPLRGIFEIARLLGPLLPSNQRDALHQKLYRKLGRFELWWIPYGRDSNDTARCADVFAQVVFETGGSFARRAAR